MPTVAAPTKTRKPTAYFAQYQGVSGILSKPRGRRLSSSIPRPTRSIPMTEPNPTGAGRVAGRRRVMHDYYPDLRDRVLARQRAQQAA